MNQTKQEAADRYTNRLRIDDWTKDSLQMAFIAGAEWHRQNLLSDGGNVIVPYHEWEAVQLTWIPVTERLPEDNGRYFCVTADDTWIVGEYEHNYIFCDPSGCSWRCKLWCPIPDSLLNFKP